MREVRSLGPTTGATDGFGVSDGVESSLGALLEPRGEGRDAGVDVGVGTDDDAGIAFAPVATSRPDKTATPATIATGLTAFEKTVRKSM